MLSVLIWTLISQSLLITIAESADHPTLPPLDEKLTEFGEYITFIEEELRVPVLFSGKIVSKAMNQRVTRTLTLVLSISVRADWTLDHKSHPDNLSKIQITVCVPF